MDGVDVGPATLHQAIPTGVTNYCSLYPVQTDIAGNTLQPWDCPNFGWTFNWNTTSVANGSHTVQIIATDSDPTTLHTTAVQQSFTVNNVISVTLTPSGPRTLGPNQTKTFIATVTGSSNQSVTWSVNAPNGLYTAPSTGFGATYTVTATSVADTTQSASALITVLVGSLFDPVTPCPIADTRAGQGFTGALGPPSVAA